MMPLGAPSISKYGSLVRSDTQIVALCAHCAQGSSKPIGNDHFYVLRDLRVCWHEERWHGCGINTKGLP